MLPKNIPLPSREEMLDHLDAQEAEVKRMNFRGLFNLRVQKRRLESSDDHAEAALIEEEIKKTEKAMEGNKEYLEEIDKMRKEI